MLMGACLLRYKWLKGDIYQVKRIVAESVFNTLSHRQSIFCHWSAYYLFVSVRRFIISG